MKFKFHKVFVKHFDKRIKPQQNLLQQYITRYQLFIIDRKNPLLNDHQLTGDLQGKRSFNVTGDIRVVYRQIESEAMEFLDIGSHNQVY